MLENHHNNCQAQLNLFKNTNKFSVVKKYLLTFLAGGLVISTATPVSAQSASRILPNRGAGSFPVKTPFSINEAGGDFSIERIQTTLNVRPDLESFNAQAQIQVKALDMSRMRRLTRRQKKYNVEKLQILLHGSRRVTQVRAGGRNLDFSHVGSFLVVDLTRNPLMEGTTRNFQINYTGKVHSMSRRFAKDYHINSYQLKYTMIPRSGNLEGTAQLEVKGVNDPFMTPKLEASLQKLEKMGRLPPDTDKTKLILTLNDEYTVDNLALNNNNKPVYYHMDGKIYLDLENPIKVNDTHRVSMNYFGKVRRIDKNLLWDNFEPIYSVRRYPTPFINNRFYGAY